MVFLILIFVYGGWLGEWVWDKFILYLIDRQILYCMFDFFGFGVNKKMFWWVLMNDYIYVINVFVENVDGLVVLVGYLVGGFFVL